MRACMQAALQEAISDTMAPSLPGGLSAETPSVLETFRVVAEVKDGCSPEAIRQYVISGAASGRRCAGRGPPGAAGRRRRSEGSPGAIPA